MSYEKTNWKTGDVITAEKLNKLEDGVASGGSGSGVSFIKIGEYNDSFGVNSTIRINATPVKYANSAAALKSIIDSGKTIINFVLDVSKDGVELQGIYVNHLNVIVHQKDEGFIDLDSTEDTLKLIYVYPEANRNYEIDFTSTIYAVCI